MRELEFKYSAAALTNVYMVLRTDMELVNAADGSIIAATDANWFNGRVDMVDDVLTSHYRAEIPDGTPASHWYYAEAYLRIGADAAPDDPRIGISDLFWWTGDSLDIPAAPISTNPATAMGYIDCWIDALPEEGVQLGYRLVDPPDGYNDTFNTDPQLTQPSDGTGRILVELLRNSMYEFWRGDGKHQRVKIGNVETALLPQILENP